MFNPGFVPQKYYGRGGFRPTYGQNGRGFGPRPFPGNGRGLNGQFGGRRYGYQGVGYQGNMIYSDTITSNTYLHHLLLVFIKVLGLQLILVILQPLTAIMEHLMLQGDLLLPLLQFFLHLLSLLQFFLHLR